MRASRFLGVLLGGLVLLSGCASRGWVKEIEGNVKQHATRIDMQTKQIDMQGKRIDGLGQKVDDLDGRVGQLARHHHAANVVEQIDVRFGFNRSDLDDGTMTRLHELAKQIKEDSRLNLELVGFTDPRGGRDYNVQLAQKRVDSVRRYLVQRGVQVSRIAGIGLGAAEDRNVADAQKRRVSILVTMHEAMVVATATDNLGSGSPGPSTKSESQ